MTWSSPTKGAFLLLQTFSLVSGLWDSWRLIWLVKTEEKKTFSTSDFPFSNVTRFPMSFRSGSTFFLVFLVSVLTGAFLVIFDLYGQIQFCLGFNFSNLISVFLDSDSVWLSDYLHCLCVSLLCWSLAWISLFIHTGLLEFLPDFLFIGIRYFWGSEPWMLTSSFRTLFPFPRFFTHESLPHRFLKRPKSAFPKFRAVTFLFTSGSGIPPSYYGCNIQDCLWPPYSLQDPCF